MREKVILANFAKCNSSSNKRNDTSALAVSLLRGHYVHVPLVDHRAYLLLAVGTRGLCAVSHRVAAAVALPHPRHRGWGRPRTGEGDYSAAGEDTARA